jgi:KAT8 regulatory NSL complex subunit 1
MLILRLLVVTRSGRVRARASTEARARAASFDIDNIVIPQSVAAATRPQILTYKEIVTPK